MEHLHLKNNSPSWFTTYGSSGNNLDGVGVVGDRLWGGIGAQFSRGINPAQFDINSLGGAGTGLAGACANRGPIYFSAQTNTTGVYTISVSISAAYGSGYGTPTMSVSTSTSSAGSHLTNGQTVGITASTTTYFTCFWHNCTPRNKCTKLLLQHFSWLCLWYLFSYTRWWFWWRRWCRTRL